MHIYVMENKDPNVIIDEIKHLPNNINELTLRINTVHMKFCNDLCNVLRAIPHHVRHLTLNGQKMAQKDRQFIEKMISAIPAHVASIVLVLNEPFNDPAINGYLNSCQRVRIDSPNNNAAIRKRAFFAYNVNDENIIKCMRLTPRIPESRSL